MASNGILQQTSCVHTPNKIGQLNAKIGISLKPLKLSFMVMFHLIFLEDIVLTMSYLINCMPSLIYSSCIWVHMFCPQSLSRSWQTLGSITQVSFLVMLNLKNVIVVILLHFKGISYRLMLPFSSLFHTLSDPLSSKVSSYNYYCYAFYCSSSALYGEGWS